MDRDELLERSHPAKAEHGTFSPSKRRVRILRTIVCPTTGFQPGTSLRPRRDRARHAEGEWPVWARSCRSRHVARRSAMGRLRRTPPRHGSSRALFVYGGAERGISLASGFFTGESTWNPPRQIPTNFRLDISGLRMLASGQVDSSEESRQSSLRNPPWRRNQPRKPPATLAFAHKRRTHRTH